MSLTIAQTSTPQDADYGRIPGPVFSKPSDVRELSEAERQVLAEAAQGEAIRKYVLHSVQQMESARDTDNDKYAVLSGLVAVWGKLGRGADDSQVAALDPNLRALGYAALAGVAFKPQPIVDSARQRVLLPDLDWMLHLVNPQKYSAPGKLETMSTQEFQRRYPGGVQDPEFQFASTASDRMLQVQQLARQPLQLDRLVDDPALRQQLWRNQGILVQRQAGSEGQPSTYDIYALRDGIPSPKDWQRSVNQDDVRVGLDNGRSIFEQAQPVLAVRVPNLDDPVAPKDPANAESVLNWGSELLLKYRSDTLAMVRPDGALVPREAELQVVQERLARYNTSADAVARFLGSPSLEDFLRDTRSQRAPAGRLNG